MIYLLPKYSMVLGKFTTYYHIQGTHWPREISLGMVSQTRKQKTKNEVEVRQTFLPLTVPKKTFLKHCREKQISADYAFVLWKCGKLRNWFREIPSISGTFWEKSGPRPGSCLENSLRTHAGYRCLQRMTVLPNFFVMPGRKQTWKGLLKSCNIVTGEYIVNQLVT